MDRRSETVWGPQDTVVSFLGSPCPHTSQIGTEYSGNRHANGVDKNSPKRSLMFLVKEPVKEQPSKMENF